MNLHVRHPYIGTRTSHFLAVLTAGTFASSFALPAKAALIVNGGPTYISGTGGYQDGVVPSHPGAAINDVGTAVGNATKFDAVDSSQGQRAVRWNADGTMLEFGILGAKFSGVTASIVYAINADNVAVGFANSYDVEGVSKGARAVRWDAGGTPLQLNLLGTNGSGVSDSRAYAINASNVAGGYATKYDVDGIAKGTRAVRWNVGGGVSELGIIGTDASGVSNAVVYSINIGGVAAGHAVKYDAVGSNHGFRAVRWGLSGAAQQLQVLSSNTFGDTSSEAYAINSNGVVVGYASAYDNGGTFKGERAVSWDGAGAALELDLLGTDPSGNTRSQAYAINESGVAVGFAQKFGVEGENKGFRAVRWGATGTASELGLLNTDLSGNSSSQAFAINNGSIVVGSSRKYEPDGTLIGIHAVYWGLDGIAIDLNDLIDPTSGWILTAASALSDTGWIAGQGTFDPDGQGGQAAYTRQFSLYVAAAAVPEPSTVGLVGLSVVIASARRRRID